LPTKVRLVKAMVFPVVMYGCESWTVKEAECWRIAFVLWCWRRLLRAPWTARRSNQSILKDSSPGCSLEGMMLKLKLQYFGHLMRRVDSLEKTLMLGGMGAGGEGDDRGWDGWMASLTRWTWVWVNSVSLWWTGRPGVLQFMGSQRVRHVWVTELNWTETQEGKLPQEPMPGLSWIITVELLEAQCRQCWELNTPGGRSQRGSAQYCEISSLQGLNQVPTVNIGGKNWSQTSSMRREGGKERF